MFTLVFIFDVRILTYSLLICFSHLSSGVSTPLQRVFNDVCNTNSIHKAALLYTHNTYIGSIYLWLKQTYSFTERVSLTMFLNSLSRLCHILKLA